MAKTDGVAVRVFEKERSYGNQSRSFRRHPTETWRTVLTLRILVGGASEALDAGRTE
jgi:hypothetical protein